MCDVGVMDEVLLLKRVNESMKEAGIVLRDVREQETDFSYEWQDHQGPHLSQQKSYSERKGSQFIFVEFEGRDRLAVCIC